MCKLNTWSIVKTLVFVGGVFTIYKLGTMNKGESVTIDGQQFKVYGKDASEFVKDIMERTEL
ncbi:hypothetical protein [Methanobrevibacter sp.]|uniref:hypothetical protein n=1 Tax=Methanobrevibacter sp. TaxID=66852 RepID=UPI00386DB5D8